MLPLLTVALQKPNRLLQAVGEIGESLAEILVNRLQVVRVAVLLFDQLLNDNVLFAWQEKVHCSPAVNERLESCETRNSCPEGKPPPYGEESVVRVGIFL